MTGVAFFVVGTLKGEFVEPPRWRAGLETLAPGGSAAALAFAIAAQLQGVA